MRPWYSGCAVVSKTTENCSIRLGRATNLADFYIFGLPNSYFIIEDKGGIIL